MRTQITLNDEEIELLDRATKASGASRSELIRRAIRITYGSRNKDDRTAALKRSAGSWRGRSFTGADYVDAVRGDLNERLSQLGLA
ncbi:ribbon-helix-helix domain-containing protein [Mycobacterium branderi]|uniref:Antitoxin n=1 Tax=Mycobacterium branderi TaxID=43348 RepID=A0A7I7WEP8_9MYCO|nr:CopG family transcriptional regulator [Mycobacterium branderi]MCV7235213.1 CopG family transcriptional regulator [Mycobacterium branderi]ORA31858.1 antitoxin [Mycobacterium branderi]BBZ14983.1 antitoxin [Mycobacterium branderi]